MPAIAAVVCAAYVLWLAGLSVGWFAPPAFLGPITTVAATTPGAPTQVPATIGILTALFSATAVLACGAALIALVACSEIDPMRFRVRTVNLTLHPWRIARLFAQVVALAMLVSVAASALWGLCARVYAPDTLAANAGAWGVVTFVMTASTTVVARAAWHAETKHLPTRPVS